MFNIKLQSYSSIMQTMLLSLQQMQIMILFLNQQLDVNFKYYQQIQLIKKQYFLINTTIKLPIVFRFGISITFLVLILKIELLSIEFKYQFNFLSDNLFFYVALENKTIFIYNPYSSRHMSLFKKLELDSIILSTTTNQQSSILFYNNTMLLLSSMEQELFKVNESLIYQNYYSLMIYRLQVTSLLHPSSIYCLIIQKIFFVTIIYTFIKSYLLIKILQYYKMLLNKMQVQMLKISIINSIHLQKSYCRQNKQQELEFIYLKYLKVNNRMLYV
ncbi:unnamed protein product [Paramecium primaurelia]|uniref:Transmembrane protein n=1 Tax=Paramecium primaurelia TaxID=5886 RepID=A0A8S1QVE3_PARPR|nr:unnamed protein product [Paramecium primaurelia]